MIRHACLHCGVPQRRPELTKRARIADLAPGEFVKVDCAACGHVALLTPEMLLRAGMIRATKVLDSKSRLRCRGCGRKGRAVVSIKWRGQGG